MLERKPLFKMGSYVDMPRMTKHLPVLDTALWDPAVLNQVRGAPRAQKWGIDVTTGTPCALSESLSKHQRAHLTEASFLFISFQNTDSLKEAIGRT